MPYPISLHLIESSPDNALATAASAGLVFDDYSAVSEHFEKVEMLPEYVEAINREAQIGK